MELRNPLLIFSGVPKDKGLVPWVPEVDINASIQIKVRGHVRFAPFEMPAPPVLKAGLHPNVYHRRLLSLG